MHFCACCAIVCILRNKGSSWATLLWVHCTMASGVDNKVALVLRQAAQRAERHAVLDSAVTSMEAVLNFPLPPEMLPWGSAMSKSYFAI